jgi:hypothetical protein
MRHWRPWLLAIAAAASSALFGTGAVLLWRGDPLAGGLSLLAGCVALWCADELRR